MLIKKPDNFNQLKNEINDDESNLCKMAKLLKKYHELNDRCSQILEKRKNRKSSGF